MFADLPLLSLLIWLPIAGGVLVLMTGDEQRLKHTRVYALLISLLTLAFCVPLYLGFDINTAEMQFQEKVSWIDSFSIYYHLGVDGISMPMIILTSFINLIAVAAGWQAIQTRVAQYMASFLILAGLMNGVFAAMDSILFYVFWEAMLIPMFLIIGIWGGENRIYATIKFFLYTFLGSVLMLVGLIYLYTQSGSFAIIDYYTLPIGLTAQILIFVGFMLAFAVKIPMWPVHTWLPDAHTEAPTAGSIILAAIMLKMGGYGFIRFSLPILPDASSDLAWLLIAMSLIAIVYIGFVALIQKDLKKLIAYSSIAHMGFVTLGFFVVFALVSADRFSAAVLGVQGAMVQMISHGFISGALFLGVGVLYERMHSRQISDYGGVANSMPIFAAFFMLFALANAGLPGTSGFVGELFVILSAFQANPWYGFWAGTALILGAAYTLWMYKRVMFGEIANDRVAALKDVNGREIALLVLLAIPVLLIGLWPQPLLEVMEVSIEHLLQFAVTSKLGF